MNPNLEYEAIMYEPVLDFRKHELLVDVKQNVDRYYRAFTNLTHPGQIETVRMFAGHDVAPAKRLGKLDQNQLEWWHDEYYTRCVKMLRTLGKKMIDAAVNRMDYEYDLHYSTGSFTKKQAWHMALESLGDFRPNYSGPEYLMSGILITRDWITVSLRIPQPARFNKYTTTYGEFVRLARRLPNKVVKGLQGEINIGPHRYMF